MKVPIVFHSKSENAQFTHSHSFGESQTNTQNSDNNHCIDEGTAKSIEEGKTKETQKTEEEAESHEENQQRSESTEKSSSVTDTKTSQTESTNTHTVGGSVGVETSASVNIGVASGSVSTKVEAHYDYTNEKRNTTGSEHSEQTTESERTENSHGWSNSASKSKRELQK